MGQISIDVEDKIEAAFMAADPQTKKELSNLVSVFLGSDWKNKNLIEVMETIAANAEKGGLTAEILEEILLS
ncbi:hypothetical protein NG796_22090 [Laspinema sp. A4]|uniref:hypothetical protein n=1 Tax=Laspinema sp. D2d TaxID=2953686 RepID=UPI0021BBA071|nr:hypothetical protein [Laspinema sp. D2d]MCT7985973.1 hypothetical protein [Laspinema sp. D2d]